MLSNERLFTRSETADLLKISLATLYRITHAGKIGRYQIGDGRILYGEQHIAAYLQSVELPSHKE